MSKRSKLFHAFTGDAIGLRDVLIEHYKRKADAIEAKGMDYAAGLDAGEQGAYREVVRFLKQLVINNDEHSDEGETKCLPQC